jgi:GDP-4-dehydro-6-deoxy-D-mannose reductase
MYNVASGRSTEGRRVLEIICRLLGREVPELRVNPSLLRPNDPRVITGSAARLRQDTGWVATRSLEEAIADFIAASADDDSTA